MSGVQVDPQADVPVPLIPVSFVYTVVNRPKWAFLPAWLRGLLGEEYLMVDVYPKWVGDEGEAKVFFSRLHAESYIRKGAGTGDVWPYAVHAVVRRHRVKG